MAKHWDGSEQGGGGGVNTIAVMQNEKVAINGDISGTQISSDRAATWQGGRGKVTPDMSDGQESPAMCADEDSAYPDRCWKGNSFGLWVSTDAGAHWRLANGTPNWHQGSTTRPRATGHQIDSDGAGNIYGVANNGSVYRYYGYGADGLGGTLQLLADLPGTGESLCLDPNNPQTCYVGIRASAGQSLWRLQGIRATAQLAAGNKGNYTNSPGESREVKAINEGGTTMLYVASGNAGMRRYVAGNLTSTSVSIFTSSGVFCAVDGYRSGSNTVLAVGQQGAPKGAGSNNFASIWVSNGAQVASPQSSFVCISLDDANMALINKMGNDTSPPWYGYFPQKQSIKSGNALVKKNSFSPEQIRFSRDRASLYMVGSQGVWRADFATKRMYPCMRRHGVTTNNDVSEIDRSVTPNRIWGINNDHVNAFSMDDDEWWTNNENVPRTFTKNGGTCVFFDKSVSPHRVFNGYGDQNSNVGTLIWNADPYANQANTAWTEIGLPVSGRPSAGACRTISGNLVVLICIAGKGIYRRVFTSHNPPSGGSWSQVESTAFNQSGDGPGTVRIGKMWWEGNTTNGVVYAYDRFTGIWRSTDAGLNFTRIVNISSNNPTSGQIAVNPDDVGQFIYTDGTGTDAGVWFVDNADSGTPDTPVRIRPNNHPADRPNGVAWVASAEEGAGVYILNEGTTGTAAAGYEGPMVWHSTNADPTLASGYSELGDMNELDQILKKASGMLVSDSGVVYISTYGPGFTTYKERDGVDPDPDPDPLAVGIDELVDFSVEPSGSSPAGTLAFSDATPGTGIDGTNLSTGQSWTIPSRLYEGGKLYLLYLHAHEAGGAAEVPGSSDAVSGAKVSSANTTWTKIEEFQATTTAVAVYRFAPSSNVTEAVTVGPFTASHEGLLYAVVEVVDADVTGTNGANAIGQSDAFNGTGTTASGTVAGFTTGQGRYRIDFVSNNNSAEAISGAIDGTALKTWNGAGDPPRSAKIVYDSDDAAGSIAWTTSAAWRMLSIEIIPRPAVVGGGSLSALNVTPGGGEESVNNTTLTIPAREYKAGKVYILALLAFDAGGAAVAANSSGGSAPTVDGVTLDWTRIEENTAATNSVAAYRCQPSATVTEAITVGVYGITHEGWQWAVIELTGADTSGVNGANAIGATGESSGTGTTATTTIAGWTSGAGHARLDIFINQNAGSTMDTVDGTKLFELAGSGDPPRNFCVVYDSEDDSSGAATWTGSAAWRALSIELIPGASDAQNIDSGSTSTPTADRVVWAVVGNVEADGSAAAPTSVEGFGLTWAQHSTTTTVDTTGGDQGRITVYRALSGSSPTSDPFIAHFAADQEAVFIWVGEISNTPLTGSNGADAERQDNYNSWAGVLGVPTVTLPAVVDPSGFTAGLAVALAPRNPSVWTETGSFVENADQAAANWSMYVNTKEGLASGDTTWEVTGAGSRWVAYYIEFDTVDPTTALAESFFVDAHLGVDLIESFRVDAYLGSIATVALDADVVATDDNIVTNSISPAASDLLSIIVNSYSTTIDPPIPTVTGLSLDWHMEDSEVYTTATAAERRRGTVFTASPGASPGSGTVTIDFAGEVQDDIQYIISQHPGASGLRQLLKNETSSIPNQVTMQPFAAGGSLVLWLSKAGIEPFELDTDPENWYEVEAIDNGLSPGGAATAVHAFAGEDLVPEVQTTTVRRQLMFAGELALLGSSRASSFTVTAMLGVPVVTPPVEVPPTPGDIPRVGWEVGGRIFEALDWKCNDVVRDLGGEQGGYDQAWIKIDKQTYEAAYESLVQGAEIYAETEFGEEVWQGRVAAPVQSKTDGTYEITGEGVQYDARNQTKRLLFQSRSYDQWVDLDSEELGYSVSDKLTSKLGSARMIVGQGKEDAIPNARKTGFAFYAEDNKITYVGFDFEKSNNLPNRELAIQEADSEGGTLTDVKVWVISNQNSIQKDMFAKPTDKPLIAIVYRTTADLTNTNSERIILTDLRVGGLAGSRTFMDVSEIATDIAKELKWPVIFARKTGYNGLPFDIIDDNWATGGLDYLMLLTNKVWRVNLDGFEIRDWDEEVWFVRRSQGATEDLQILPYYNRVRVKFNRPSGRSVELVRKADPDPLAQSGVVKEYLVELSDGQPDRELAKDVAATVMDQVTTERYAGMITTSFAYREDGTGTIMGMRAGTKVRIEDWGTEGFQGTHRVHEIEKTPTQVTIGINQEVSVARKLARVEHKRRKRGRG